MKLTTEDQRRWHACLRKQAYPSSQAAYTAGRHQGLKRRSFEAYLCPYCSLWHIARKTPRPAGDEAGNKE